MTSNKSKSTGYPLEFPSEEYKKDLKALCVLEDKTMKEFILEAIDKEVGIVKNRRWMEEH